MLLNINRACKEEDEKVDINMDFSFVPGNYYKTTTESTSVAPVVLKLLSSAARQKGNETLSR